MNSDDLKRRTKSFALRIIRLVESLPPGTVANVIGRQLAKCGASVGANYRAACRAKSNVDFIAKMGIVEEEASVDGNPQSAIRNPKPSDGPCRRLPSACPSKRGCIAEWLKA